MTRTIAAVWLAFALPQEPRPAERTVASFQVPEGFSVKLFAGEPDLRQPIGFSIDDRGRLWVIEGDSYPAWRENLPERDRVYVFEDADGDGRFDTRKLFADGLAYATGIEVGFGGVWIIAPPRLLFYPDRDGDDRPDGPPETLLDGFGVHGGHNVANGFTWGPDGWLYGGHGRTSISDIGRPGAPMEERIHFDGGVYRYHPVRRVFEPFADGSTNPWGVAFDETGQAFVSNCVNAHLFHVIQGAHYEPWRDRPSSRHAYRRIDAIADHLHFATGRADSFDGSSAHAAHGGGHAHSGAMIYLGDSWPDRYRGSMFMVNLHGRRINNDILRRKGSGFVASHGPEFLQSGDPMFMGLLLQYGPDGSAYLSDWYDRGECHTRDPHRATGRIYKIVYRDAPSVRADLGRLSDEELVKLQLHKNDWFVTRARRLLQERAQRGPVPRVHEALGAILEENPDVTRKLRALWALHVTGGLTEARRLALLGHAQEQVRAWTIQLELEDRDVPDGTWEKLAGMAASDPSPVVRLYLAAACRRLPPERRGPILQKLVEHAEDAEDPNLPLLIWYAAEPLAEANLGLAADLLKRSKIPLVREFMARRIAALRTDRPVVNVASLGARGDGTTDDGPAFQAAIERIAKTGGRVLIPWGVRPYRIARPLVVASDHVELWGPGARLAFAPGAGLSIRGPVRGVALRGFRVEGESGLVEIRDAADVKIEDFQARGVDVRIAGVRDLSIAGSRFESLQIDLPAAGAPAAELRRVTVDGRYGVTGDRSGLKIVDCRLPRE